MIALLLPLLVLLFAASMFLVENHLCASDPTTHSNRTGSHQSGWRGVHPCRRSVGRREGTCPRRLHRYPRRLHRHGYSTGAQAKKIPEPRAPRPALKPEPAGTAEDPTRLHRVTVEPTRHAAFCNRL